MGDQKTEAVFFTWKDASRNEWAATITRDSKADTTWWAHLQCEDSEVVSLPVEIDEGVDQPDRRQVALAIMAYFNGVALSLITDPQYPAGSS